jgi:large subunit ribosomal protein L5
VSIRKQFVNICLIYMERLQEQYTKEIAPALKQKFGIKNIMQVPKITKVVINIGVGKIVKDAKMIETIVGDIKKITGQAPVKTLARKSISGFKVRENQVVGIMVTLRGYRMYSFLDKLIHIALPRVRDFQGVNAAGFDGRGNYHLGLREHVVFPEVATSGLEHVFGMEISIVTNAGVDDKARELLTQMKFPFKK